LNIKVFGLAICLGWSLVGCATNETGDYGVDILSNGLGGDVAVTAGSVWTIKDGILKPARGKDSSYVYTKKRYSNLDLTLEFYPEGTTNSGAFVRCSDTEAINPETCYELNIWDSHENAASKTGAVVLISPPGQPVETEDKWNSMHVLVQGPRIQVWVNGTLTNDITHEQHTTGNVAFQYGGAEGMVMFRNIRIKELL